MQAETGSELLSHLSVFIDCHVTGITSSPLPVLAVPSVSSGSSTRVHTPTPAHGWLDTARATAFPHVACGLKTSFPPWQQISSPPSLKVRGTSPPCATAGEPAPAPGDEQPTRKPERERQVRSVLPSRSIQWQGVKESYIARSHPNHAQGEVS